MVGCVVAAIFAPQHSSSGSSFKYCSSLSQQVVSARRLQSFSYTAAAAARTSSLASSSAAAVTHITMANSRFQYVKKFELSDALLPDTYLVARLDGHRFTKFTAEHGFTKPNDERGLLLMAEVRWRALCCVQEPALLPCGGGCLLCVHVVWQRFTGYNLGTRAPRDSSAAWH